MDHNARGRVHADVLPSSGSSLNTAAKRGSVCALLPLSMGTLQSHQRLGQALMSFTDSHSTAEEQFNGTPTNFNLNFYKTKVIYSLGLQNTILSHHFGA